MTGEDDETIAEYCPNSFQWVHEIRVNEEMRQLAGNCGSDYVPTIDADTRSYNWNGLRWSLFQRYSNKQYQFYAGVDDTSHLQTDWKQQFRIKFDFESVSFKGDFEINEIFCVLGGRTNRQDIGKSHGLDLQTLIKEVDEMRAKGEQEQEQKQAQEQNGQPGEDNVIMLKVTVTEVFKPREIYTLNWNSKSKTGMLGLRNLGATCYLNALLQMLYHMNTFRTAVYRIPHDGEKLESSITLALQDVFRNLQAAPVVAIGNDTCVTTKHLAKAFGWTSNETFLQQDATELLKFLIDRLEQKMGPDAIKILFEGSTKNFIRCVNVPVESSHEEAFQDIQLDVEGCDNIYQSINKFVAVERLDGENQYDAGDVHGKQDAEKGTEFTKFPHILTVHLKRFAFNSYSMNYSKIHTKFAFPERLHMDKFLTKKGLPDQPTDDEPTQPSIYRLHSILIHRGDVGSGHYYSFVKPSPVMRENLVTKHIPSDTEELPAPSTPPRDALPGAEDSSTNATDPYGSGWYRFDDERVYAVEKAEAVDYNYGQGILNHSAASAYMLMYIRESMIETVRNHVSVRFPAPLLN